MGYSRITTMNHQFSKMSFSIASTGKVEIVPLPYRHTLMMFMDRKVALPMFMKLFLIKAILGKTRLSVNELVVAHHQAEILQSFNSMHKEEAYLLFQITTILCLATSLWKNLLRKQLRKRQLWILVNHVIHLFKWHRWWMELVKHRLC